MYKKEIPSRNSLETWTSAEVKHNPHYDRYREIATAIQRCSGISFKEEMLFLITKNPQMDVPHTFDFNHFEENSRRIINIPEGTTDLVAGHEIAHHLLEIALSEIKDRRIKNALTEGLADLASYEAIKNLNPDIPEKLEDFLPAGITNPPPPEAIERYCKSHPSDDEITFIDRAGQKRSLAHLLGRQFVYYICQKRPEVTCRELLNSLTKKPPTREEITDPESYLQTIDSLTNEEITEPIQPKLTYFRDAPKRIF